MKPIFSRNVDVNKIAFLNWRISSFEEIHNILVLADGYLSSSIELAEVCLENNRDKKADMLIFPILANANHGIELYLKAMLWTLNTIMKRDTKIEGRHNIKQILETVRKRIDEYEGYFSIKEFDQGTKELQDYINELYVKIQATPQKDKMDFSRYPMSDKYTNHFYVNEIGNVEIDLENFVIRFKLIRRRLDDITAVLYYGELRNEW